MGRGYYTPPRVTIMDGSILPKNETIVYVARKLHWARSEIGRMKLPQFYALVNELQYQEQAEKYERYSFYNTLLSEIHNAPITKPKIRYPQDYYQIEEPLRFGEKPKQKKNTAKEMLNRVQALNAAFGGNYIVIE